MDGYLQVFSNEGQWFWQLAGTIAIVISLLFVFRQVRLQRNSHLIDALEQLVGTWNSRQFLILRGTVCAKLKSDITYFGDDTEELLEFFERIGLYVKLKALPKSAAWEAFSWYIEYYGHISVDGIEGVRSHFSDHLLYQNFTWLVSEMERISKVQYSKSHFPMSNLTDTEERVLSFLNGEIATSTTLLEIDQPS